MEAIEPGRVATNPSRWMRAFYIVFFMAAFGLAQTVLGLLTVVQFVWMLATGEPNPLLRGFGGSLARWFGDVVRFLSCSCDDKPFPWREWPTSTDT
jgi:hypothetical protein